MNIDKGMEILESAEFFSILYETYDSDLQGETCLMPEFFKDLNLDQIIKEILEGKEDYRLDTFFYRSLRRVSDVNYRLDVMRELENPSIFSSIVAFANDMVRVREYLEFSKQVHNIHQKQKWHLDAACLYCSTVMQLNDFIQSIMLNSKGLRLFKYFLDWYVNSVAFQTIAEAAGELSAEFDNIRYSLHIEPGRITIYSDDNYDEDYSSILNDTFKPIIDQSNDQPIRFFTGLEMCPLENRILEIVRRMNPEAFRRLEQFSKRYNDFMNITIIRFDREIQFYISYLEYISKLRSRGFHFSYPGLSEVKAINVVEGYDLALAYKNSQSGKSVIPNDFRLNGEERIFVLTGRIRAVKRHFQEPSVKYSFLLPLDVRYPAVMQICFYVIGFLPILLQRRAWIQIPAG